MSNPGEVYIPLKKEEVDNSGGLTVTEVNSLITSAGDVNPTANTLVKRNATGGGNFTTLSATGALNMNYQAVNNIICLNGDATNVNATDFYGFGVNTATLRCAPSKSLPLSIARVYARPRTRTDA
jgi:hypothetical protein